jgi:hypothetical protein
MSAGLVFKIGTKLTSKAVSRTRYTLRTVESRRAIADFGRRSNAPKLREAYRRSYDEAREKYARKYYEQYQQERGLLPKQRNIPQPPREPISIPTGPRRRISDPRLARRNSAGAKTSTRSQLERLPRYRDFPDPPPPQSGLNWQRPPAMQRAPRSPLRQALENSRKTNEVLRNINRNLNDIALPGLNQISDFLADQTIRFIKETRRKWRQSRSILEESRESQETSPPPESNLTLPINPNWRDPDEITVIYGGTSFINDDGWQWLPGALLSLPSHWVGSEDYAFITIQGGTLTINASSLFDGNVEDPSIYYSYTSFTFLVGNLRTVNGRVDRLAVVTNSVGDPYSPIDVITPSGRWEPGSESSPPPEQEFEIVPRINRRLRRIIEEREERETVSCDLSPLMVAMRQILAANNSLNAQLTQANLAINANINELKPPINNTNNVVNVLRTKVDEILQGVQRNFNRIGEIFEEITKRLDKWARWFRLPMLLDALSFILLLHNAAMLSSNVVQTVGEIINTGLQIIGLKDPDGGGFDSFDVVGKQVDQFMSSILGQENWTKTKTTWKKLNNIYQAAANVINSMQSIIDSARSIMELGAEMTGKIGNALRKAGVVFENAFNLFTEQINAATARQTKLNGMIQGIQGIDDAASSLSSAVSEVKSIQDTVIEMREQRQKFNEAVNELVTGKADAKTKSQSTTIQPSDLKP